MVGYYEYGKVYNIFYPSSQNTFIERAIQFKKELMQETELAHGECSHPPLHDDVSDESFYDFYDMHSDHDSPIWPKWAEKTIEATGDLAGDPLDSRKTRTQFHNDYYACKLNLVYRCLMMLGYNPQTYQEA